MWLGVFYSDYSNHSSYIHHCCLGVATYRNKLYIYINQFLLMNRLEFFCYAHVFINIRGLVMTL